MQTYDEKTVKKLSDVDLVDELGMLCAQCSELGKQERLLKEELKERAKKFGYPRKKSIPFEGVFFRAVVAKTVRNLLDLEAAKAKLGLTWVRRHSNEQAVTRITTTAKTGINDHSKAA
jgi:hypothetical protein